VSGLTGQSRGLVVDYGDNFLWDADSILGLVAVNLSSLAIGLDPGTSVPISSSSSIAIDPVAHELFVVKSNVSVTILNSSTGQVVRASVSAGTNLTSVAFDSQDDAVYVAGDGVAIISPDTGQVVSGPLPIAGSHSVLAMLYDPSRDSVLISIELHSLYHTGAIVAVDGSSIASFDGTYTMIGVGESPADIAEVSFPATQIPGSTELWVTNNQSGTVTVISSPPVISVFNAVPQVVDLGQRTSVLLQFEGGAGKSNIEYFGFPSGCSPTGVLQFNCTPSSAGTFTLFANVTDSLGYFANSTSRLVVSRTLQIESSFHPSTLPYLDVNVSLDGYASAMDGTPPYSYVWSFGDGTSAAGPNSTHQFSAAGPYEVRVTVQDSTGESNSSSTIILVVHGPTARLHASPGNVTDVNVPILVSAYVGGGIDVGGGNWTFGDGSQAAGFNVSHAWNRPGNYSVKFTDSDRLGTSVNETLEVLVHSSLSATFKVENPSSTSSVDPGSPLTFASNITGGTMPYALTWSFGDGSYANGLSVNHSYSNSGTFTVALTLYDAVGASVRSNLTVTVAQNASTIGGLSSLGGGFTSGLFLGLLVGGVLAAVVLFAAGLRKGRRPRGGPVSPYVPP